VCLYLMATLLGASANGALEAVAAHAGELRRLCEGMYEHAQGAAAALFYAAELVRGLRNRQI